MKENEVKIGLRVRVATLGSTTGMLIKPKHLTVRQEGKVGTVLGWVSGHGGDVWWVKHDGSDDIGAYGFPEMEPLEDQTPYEEPLGSPRAPDICG